MIIAELYMRSLCDIQEVAANEKQSLQHQHQQMAYMEMYRQYLASFYQMSNCLQTEQSAAILKQLTNEKLPGCTERKAQSLWSPAKLVEIESNESVEETSREC